MNFLTYQVLYLVLMVKCYLHQRGCCRSQYPKIEIVEASNNVIINDKMTLMNKTQINNLLWLQSSLYKSPRTRSEIV